jgi:hypothetical protein
MHNEARCLNGQNGQNEEAASNTYAHSIIDIIPTPNKHNVRAKLMSSIDFDTVDGIPIPLPNTHNFRARSTSSVLLGGAYGGKNEPINGGKSFSSVDTNTPSPGMMCMCGLYL